MEINIETLTITEASKLLDEGKITSQELTQIYLERIKKLDPKIKAYLYVNEEEALSQAKKADEMRKGGKRHPLLGIPLAIKDNICIKGTPTTCASKMLENYIAPYDATVIKKLKEAGCVFIGKTNMDEFAMGSSTENSAFFPTKNPWDLERVPGGSSGGSAAATSARLCLGALGSDTGGSIRQPACFCGVYGLKPTYGLVSRYGLVAFASSLDQIGPFANSIEDLAIILETIAGHDPMDSTSAPKEVPSFTRAIKTPKKFKIGLVKECLEEGIDKEIFSAIEELRKELEKEHEIKEVSLPHIKYAVATYYIIAPAEASSNLARYDGIKYGLRISDGDLLSLYRKTRGQGFGREVKRRIMLGTYALSAGYYDAFYLKASKVRTLIKEDYEKAFSEVDLLITPVSPVLPFKLGEKISDPLQMYLSDIFTIPINLAGVAGLSMPIKISSNGLPIGIQIIAKHFCDDLALNLGAQIEKMVNTSFVPPVAKEV